MPPTDNAEALPQLDDGLDALTDRQLLLVIARDIASTRALAAEAAARVQPLLDSVSKNPMFKLLLK